MTAMAPKKVYMYDPKSQMHRRKVIASALRIALVSLLLIIVLLPFYVAVLYAFKPVNEISQNRLAFSSNPTLENFRSVIFDNKAFLVGYKNSILNTIPTVIILMGFTSMAAWVLARNETRGYNLIYAVLTLGLLIPFQCFELPLFVNWKAAGLDSTNIGFIIARAGLQISISMVAVTGFVKTVPRELEQAAGIDGCNRFQTFWKVVFPLMTPINVTQLVLNTLFIWNDYSTSVILLRDTNSYSLTLAQIRYFNGKTNELNPAFAFFIMSMIPILILYLACQRYIISGITAGAVKG
ncbi:MAG: carbohydrate ABC transporter permease [Clostridiales bacterium]|nr:carbohydrate ABC transporter permease [Clostridiales bacterium]